ncbi:MAG TPA: hypothetical protein VKA94_01380 [Hyphomicrobiales bacterium]|nr:hypothetical protein [Hyphomicrobiales bacterium]
MNERKLYQQKMQAQLDEWNAEVDNLKAKASGAKADVQLGLNKQIKALEGEIEDGKAKLAEIADASEEVWDSMRNALAHALAKIKR